MTTIRPAIASDLDQILNISTWYILNTAINFSYRPPSKETILAIYNATLYRNLPYLVAVDTKDEVKGYVYASPYPSPRLSYAHTLELSIFVDPAQKHQGVGSKLLASLLEHLRTNKHFAFEPGFEDEVRKTYARKLVAKMSYDSRGPERDASEALRKWYAGWGFVEVGIMKEVGFKFGRFIDTMDHILDLQEYYERIGASTEHLRSEY